MIQSFYSIGIYKVESCLQTNVFGQSRPATNDPKSKKRNPKIASNAKTGTLYYKIAPGINIQPIRSDSLPRSGIDRLNH